METINLLRIGKQFSNELVCPFKTCLASSLPLLPHTHNLYFRLSTELAEEVATLPEALRSSYPDLAVDFLYTVFKETASDPITR
jgi:hypothetical protein